MYQLVEDFSFDSYLFAGVITVPKGFVSDLASIPRPLQNFIQKDEPLEAAIIHDWLYSWQCGLGISREAADNIFLEAMTVAGMGRIKRGLVYNAVRYFGGKSWRVT
jgi:hypothetical protein